MNDFEMELEKLTSFKAIRNVLDGLTLHDLQCADVLKMLYEKRAMVIYDTGTGKTLLTAAAMRLLWNEEPSRRFIMFVKKDQLAQTPEKLKNACGRDVIASAADAKSLDSLFSCDFISYSVLMLTHECLQSRRMMDALFRVKGLYCGVVVDEAHELCNLNHASSASMLSRMVRNFEYCWALTATPVISDVVQLAKLAVLVDPERYPNSRRLELALRRGAFSIKEDSCFFINRNHEDFGAVCDYRGSIEWVQPLPHQKRPMGGAELFQICKGDGAYPQAERLVELILRRKMKSGLIYVQQHEVRKWILPFFDEAGIRYECINGYTKFEDRKRIMHEFNVEKSLDVIVTSVTTALDLDCDYVIFYEFTLDLKQMIGRAHRGLSSKTLDIIFIITDETSEVDYFAGNIMERSLMIRDLLGKNYAEIEDAERSLKERYA